MKNFKQIISTGIFVLCLLLATNVIASNYLEEAKQYYEKGEYNAAIIQFKNHLKENPKDVTARFLLGTSYFKTGHIVQADKEISRAYQLDNNNEDVVLGYAQLLLVKKKFNETLQMLDRQFSVAEKENQRQIYRGYAFLGLNQLADAKQIFSELMGKQENIQIYNGLAKLAILENEYDEAKKWLNRSIEKDRNNLLN